MIEHRFACFAEREVSKLTQTKVCNSTVSDELLKYKKNHYLQTLVCVSKLTSRSAKQAKRCSIYL